MTDWPDAPTDYDGTACAMPAAMLALAALAGFTAAGGAACVAAFARSWITYPEHRPRRKA